MAFTVTSSNCKVKIAKFYTKLKINKKLIFVQVFSPVARFIPKIQEFELPSFQSA